MSTKTTLKRLALVAVSAMGFGLLSAVPSSAAITFTSVTVGSIPAVRVGETATVAVTVNMSANLSTDTVTVAAKVVSAPMSGGNAAVNNGMSTLGYTATTTNASDSARVLWFGNSNGTVGTQKDSSNTAYPVTTSTAFSASAQYSGVFKSGTTAAGAISGATAAGVAAAATDVAALGTANILTSTVYLSFKPDVAGSYTFIVSAADDGSGLGNSLYTNRSYVAGDTSTTFTVTASATGPSSITLSSYGSHPIGSADGSLVKVTLKDSAGGASTIAGDEAIGVSISGGYVIKAGLSSGNFTSGTMGTATTATLTSSDFLNGVAFLNVLGTAVGTVTVTATGTGTLASTVATSATVTASYAETMTDATFTYTGPTTGQYNSTVSTTAPTWDVTSTATSTSLKWTFTDPGATVYGQLNVVDKGAITSLTNTTGNTLRYNLAYSIADDDVSKTISISHAALGDYDTVAAYFTVVNASGNSAKTLTFQGQTAAAATVAVSPGTSFKAATGSSNAITATVTDQFGSVAAGVAVTVSVTGRNSARASETLITNAAGVATTTIVDAGTSGTTDSVLITSGSGTKTVTITYGTFTAATVLLTTPNTTALGVDEYPTDAEDISAGDGAEASLKTATATVKDANALAIAGVPVTFTISGTGAAITSTTQTVYTNVNGQASASVYGWLAGTYTITATAGAVSDTAPIIFAQETATEVRTLSSTVSGGNLTVTAKDRFGNVIEGVALKATRTAGEGSLGASTSATGTTDANGQVTFIVTGSATIKVTFDSTVASTYGQSDALKGLLDGTTATNVFTAYTAGTALEAEEGVGASYDAAGINSVTVDVTGSDNSAAAADAAAEATDAANAATDAANAAAEAADAATAAAQDAADAVAALSAQVASLISGLKAQLTALTNLVIKIQKKVKA
jgi:hypothetical protein